LNKVALMAVLPGLTKLIYFLLRHLVLFLNVTNPEYQI